MKLTEKMRNWIIGGALVLLTVMVFGKYHDVMGFKSEEGIAHFYKEQIKTVDVFAVGSSHIYCNIDPSVLWGDDGISSYLLSGPAQPIWNSYYYIKDGLNYQKPKLIVLDGYCLHHNYNYINDIELIRNTTGMRWGINKWNAYKDGTPTSKRFYFVAEYIQYHKRYKELFQLDFFLRNSYLAHNKGFHRYALSHTKKQKIPMWVNDNEYAALNNKQEQYFRKIIELCQENDIPLLIVITPYSSYNQNNHRKYNTAKKIAMEYGVPFYNFHEPEYLSQIGIDWQNDYSDNHHMNYTGSRKFSKFFAAFLKEHYGDLLPDHRGDPRYASWDENKHYIDNYGAKSYLVNEKDTNAYVKYLDKLSDEYLILVSAKGKLPDKNHDSVKEWLKKYGIPYDKAHNECTWVISKDSGAKRYTKGKLGYYYLSSYDGKDLVADQSGIYFDGLPYIKVSDGVNIVVFDQYCQHVTDAIGINQKGIKR